MASRRGGKKKKGPTWVPAPKPQPAPKPEPVVEEPVVEPVVEEPVVEEVVAEEPVAPAVEDWTKKATTAFRDSKNS